MAESKISNLKVLVADDNPDHVQIITEILDQELKAKVEAVTKGEECLKKVKKNKYDLLLLDYIFPEISGLDILREIVDKGYHLPIIMISGYGSEKVAVEAMKAGAIDYIVKSEDGFQSLPFVAKKAIEKEQLRKRLRQSEEKFQNLFESATDVIIYLDRAGRILEANKQAVQVFGASKPEVLGKQLNRLGVFPPGEIAALLNNFAGVLAGREATQDVRLTNKKGRKIVLECSASVMKTDDKVIGVMIIARDITERRRAEEKIRQTLAELERSNAELEQFAHVASHDLREPLRTVSSYAQLLEERYKDRLDADALDFIHFAVDGAVRMQILIDDLLTYSGIGKSREPFSRTDCEAVYEAAVSNLAVAIGESQARVTHDPLPTVMANEGQMTQVFQNLIDNAVKFRGRDAPRIHVSAQPDKEDWIFSVRDNGIGIDPQYFDRIFIIFQRLHREERPGRGIGLAIVKKIIELHDGRIWLESRPGQGSVFYFTIPMKRGGQNDGKKRLVIS